MQKGVSRVAFIYLELILVIFLQAKLKIYYFKNLVVFSMDHPCGLLTAFLLHDFNQIAVILYIISLSE